jgi:hypothetical protein
MTALRLFGLPTPYFQYDSGRPLGARLVLARPRARGAVEPVEETLLAGGQHLAAEDHSGDALGVADVG